jgi:hypothetical protein
MMNVEPEAVRKIKVTTVCLEHGKDEPHPRAKYKMVPIDSFTKQPEVIELCKMLGSGQLNQAAAQAAAWHFTNNMSWDQLYRKVGKVHLHGWTEPYFRPQEVQFGMRIAAEVTRRASANPIYREKSDSLSSR